MLAGRENGVLYCVCCLPGMVDHVIYSTKKNGCRIFCAALSFSISQLYRSVVRRQYAHTRQTQTIVLSQQGANNTNTCGCRDKATQCTDTRRFIYHVIFGFFFLRSSSAFRRIVAVVRAQIHSFDIKMNMNIAQHRSNPVLH